MKFSDDETNQDETSGMNQLRMKSAKCETSRMKPAKMKPSEEETFGMKLSEEATSRGKNWPVPCIHIYI